MAVGRLRRAVGRKLVLAVVLAVMLSGFVAFRVADQRRQEQIDAAIEKLSEGISYWTGRIDEWRERVGSTRAVPGEAASVVPAEQEVVPGEEEKETPAEEKEVPAEEKEVVGQPSKKPAVYVLFARTGDLQRLLHTVRTVETRFNSRHKYDFLVVSELNLSSNFKKTMQSLTSSDILYKAVGKVGYPDGIDKGQVSASKRHYSSLNIAFEKSMKKRHASRFMAREVFLLPELDHYEYFISLGASLEVTCDIQYDIIRFMREKKKTFGFTSVHATRLLESYKTLWDSVLQYVEEHPAHISANNLVDFISDDKGESFNTCQLNSVLSVGLVEFFRGDAYQQLAEFLDSKYGMYYENWDISTFFTMGVSLLEDKSKVQFFNNIGYYDGAGVTSCPFEPQYRAKNQCVCDPLADISWDSDDTTNCLEKYFGANLFRLPEYVDELRLAIQENKDGTAANEKKRKKEEARRKKLEKQRKELEKKKAAQAAKEAERARADAERAIKEAQDRAAAVAESLENYEVQMQQEGDIIDREG